MGAPKTADQIPADADARERINGTELYGPLFFLSVLAGARDGDADVRLRQKMDETSTSPIVWLS